MKQISDKYPVDLLFCLLYTILAMPIILFNLNDIVRIIFSLPAIFFIPGYLLTIVLFIEKKGINDIERITLSFGLSITILPLILLCLNYTPWGISLESILFSLSLFIIIFGVIAFIRWIEFDSNQRYTVTLHFFFQKLKNTRDHTLNTILILSVIIALIVPIYLYYTSGAEEKFTEFLLIDYNDWEKYPKNITQGVQYSRILEITNHEYEPVTYTIEIWLINQSVQYNESENRTITSIDHMWFLGKRTTPLLKPIPLDIGESLIAYWENASDNSSNLYWKNDSHKPLFSYREYNASFIINRNGSFKLTFLLFKTPTENYIIDEDYKDIADEKIRDAYREVHQWINVYYRVPPKADFIYTLTENNTVVFISNCTSPDSRIVNWTWDFGDGISNNSKDAIGLEFDGIDDYIDCGNDTNMQPVNGTIEVLINLKNLTGTRFIFTTAGPENRRHPNLRFEGRILRFILSNNSRDEWHSYRTNFQTDVWYHIAATWNGSDVSYYVNGSLKDIQPQNIIPVGNSLPKRIGALNPPSFPETFHGIIRDLRIYNRSLDSDEVLSNYNGFVNTLGLVSWWKMDTIGDIVIDFTGRNNGTIYGANYINQASHVYNKTGIYNVELTITNQYGQINSISKSIVVN
jgi:uncharacterized membrane protein